MKIRIFIQINMPFYTKESASGVVLLHFRKDDDYGVEYIYGCLIYSEYIQHTNCCCCCWRMAGIVPAVGTNVVATTVTKTAGDAFESYI